jgi:hypothetical protein
MRAGVTQVGKLNVTRIWKNFGIAWFRRQDMPDVRIESLADIKLHSPDVCFTHGWTLRSDYPIDAGSSLGVRVLGENVDRNPAAKSKSSLLFLGAVERSETSQRQQPLSRRCDSIGAFEAPKDFWGCVAPRATGLSDPRNRRILGGCTNAGTKIGTVAPRSRSAKKVCRLVAATGIPGGAYSANNNRNQEFTIKTNKFATWPRSSDDNGISIGPAVR